nr:putative ubiquitination network signaling protein acrb [Quercus suber]
MPPKAKSKTAPNQHDKRHETGLAAPGKRVTKQRSSGNLHGQLNGKSGSAVPPPALPVTGLNSGYRFRHPDPVSGIIAESSSQTSLKDHGSASEHMSRDRTSSEVSFDEGGPYMDAMVDTSHESGLSNGVDADLYSSKHRPSTSSLTQVSTILTYYPLRDAISILILLLSLPPTLVLVIQTLFASLTFVPPTAGISFASIPTLPTWPNLKEVLNASGYGYPAMATILFVDSIFWISWLAVPKLMQVILLDLSQAVIAVSLSGAAASVGGPTYSILTCTAIVCIVHVLRYRAIHLTALDYLRSVIHKVDINLPVDGPPSAGSVLTTLERGWVTTVLRTILGIHILSQGVTTSIRRSLVKANEREQVPASSKPDPEASAGSDSNLRLDLLPSDSAAQHSLSSSRTDSRASTAPYASSTRDSKARESSSKKKRKQANQVRSQQPLWAAIASTKVTFVKEMKQREAANDAREASSMTNKSNTTFLSANNKFDCIWISEVRDSEIIFSVELSPESTNESADRLDRDVMVSSGIDKSKPFFVRVNGAAWSSTRIVSSAIGDDAESNRRFDGEIFGLAPKSMFHCELVGIASGRRLCDIRLITQPAPSAEQIAAAPAQPQHSSLRPSSPITTLRQSIQSAETKLAETRIRTRKSKRDHRGAYSDIRRETNALKLKLDSSGGQDDKQERRMQQITTHKNQAEEAVSELKAHIDSFGELSASELSDSAARKRSWQEVHRARKAADKDLDNAKWESDREMSVLKADMASAESKREKLESRRIQREQELERITAKHQEDMTTKQKRDFERSQVLQSRHNDEIQLQYHINNMNTETRAMQQKTQDAYQSITALQHFTTAQPPPYPGYSSPPTPDKNLMATNDSLSSQQNSFAAYIPQTFQLPFNPQAAPHVPRGRSSSMLSQYSGLTDIGADEVYMFGSEGLQQSSTWSQVPNYSQAGSVILGDQKESDGSQATDSTESSSPLQNSRNSPRPDAKPFVPLSKIGVIGTPAKTRSPAHTPGVVGDNR